MKGCSLSLWNGHTIRRKVGGCDLPTSDDIGHLLQPAQRPHVESVVTPGGNMNACLASNTLRSLVLRSS